MTSHMLCMPVIKKKYDSEWDGKENSTLLKIQETLNNVYNLEKD